MNKYRIFLFAACLGMATAASAGGVYKYEKDGKVIYSDQPPPNTRAQKIDSYSSKNPESRPTSEPVEQDTAERSAIRSKECAKARARLAEYQEAPTLIQRNLKGEQVTLSAQERIDVLVRAQVDVNELCGEPEPSAPDDGLNDLTAETDSDG